MSDRGKYSAVLEGFNSLEEVEAWLDWYGGQGEQDDCMGDYMEASLPENHPRISFVSLSYPLTKTDITIKGKVLISYEKNA
jgi:hypothetical protein